MNYKVIRYIIGLVLKFEALAMLLPLAVSLIYREYSDSKIFLLCIAITFVYGLLFSIKTKGNKKMYAKEGFVAVALSWIIISIFGLMPFFFSGKIPSFVDAMFETVSGFTTTGASIIDNLEGISKSMLFWRSFTHWIGGMGVLVLLVAILPISGSDNFFLMKAESPGPAVSKLVPKVRATAKILYLIYIFMTVLEIILLLIGGMEPFDSVTLSLGTAGTGGFGIRASSIADYSPYCQIVITVFMLLFGIDFSVYYLILTRKARDAFKSDEVKGYLLIVLSAIVLITINCYNTFSNVFETLRHASFQVASIITTTGYATCNFDLWPEFSKSILVLLMFIGACAGSTGGGIKVSRIIIFLKSIAKEIRMAVHPRSAIKISMNGRPVEHETIRAVNVFIASYAAIFAASLLIVSLDNFDFTTNFTAVAATMNNIGPGLAGVGPTQSFSSFSVLSKVVFIFDMLLGRLEIFPMLVLFSPFTWKK